MRAIVLHLSRYMRLIWHTNINDLTSEGCKAVIELLKEFQTGLQRIEPIMERGRQKVMRQLRQLLDKLQQLLMLIKCVSLLPNLSLCEALAANLIIFESFIFRFLHKHCEGGSIEYFKHNLPLFMTPHFYAICKLYESVAP